MGNNIMGSQALIQNHNSKMAKQAITIANQA